VELGVMVPNESVDMIVDKPKKNEMVVTRQSP
jgi:hypothetical protein